MEKTVSDDMNSPQLEQQPQSQNHRGLIIILVIFAGLLGLLIGSQVLFRS
jgi:hypothetical protein